MNGSSGTAVDARVPRVLMAPRRDALLAAARRHAASACQPPWRRVMDLGCGTGLMGPLLAAHLAPGGSLEGGGLGAAVAQGGAWCSRTLWTARRAIHAMQAWTCLPA